MARRRRFSSNTVRTVGALLPSDVLAKALAGEGLEGLDAEAYGLDADVRFRDVVSDAWNQATALWWRFQSELRDLPSDDATATALTRERWLLPLLDLLGFDDVEVVGGALEVGAADYPISHMWEASPLHLMGARMELDGRISGIRGAARLSPHSLIQQFLNRSDDHLWGIVSNGRRLRIVRDSVSLTRQAFVEFDLESMFNSEVFVDFALLFRVAHATRFHGEERPEDCLLEVWIASARDDGIRAMDQLREGVELALTTFGTGFLRHRDNAALRGAADSGELDPKQLYRYLLRLVYRLLFLFVAEDRDLLLVPDADAGARERYDRFYSTLRVRDLAARPTGSGHGDLWAGLTALMAVLGRDEGEPALGLPGLGSFLWAADSIGPLIDARLDNEDLLTGLRGLAYVDDGGTSRRIDFARMGAEELGSVYESLLELHPAIDAEEQTFTLGEGAGSERKTTGSYYTPTELISELLDSALEPVLDEAAGKDDPEKAILDLKVVDPAVGSGHFLVAAAHRIAKRLAEARTAEPEPPEDAYRTAIRDVVSHCLFAVDINDLAVELCKVSLWLEALEPGKPLSFLDHHILVGNSLFGATPAAIADGIPNDAFVALTGDDKKIVSELKKRNKRERSGQDTLAFAAEEMAGLGAEIEALEQFDDEDLETVRAKERMLADWKASDAYTHARLVADSWCAAFVIEKKVDSPQLTEATFRRLRDGAESGDDWRGPIEELADRYGFFHWHLAFPRVFKLHDVEGSGWSGGFDVVLGNPPWERVKLQEKEFFATTAPEIASAPNKAARQRLIDRLDEENPPLLGAFRRAVRDAEGISHFLHASGVYPLGGRGDVNTATVFTELVFNLVSSGGQVGIVVPTSIATDHTTRRLFSELVTNQALVSLFDFINNVGLFPGVGHGRQKFALMTLRGSDRSTTAPQFAFYLQYPSDLRDENRKYTISLDDLVLLNPNTRTAPIFKTRRDAELTTRLYRRWRVISDGAGWDPWQLTIRRVFDMADEETSNVAWSPDSATPRPDGTVSLYEAKMLHQFDFRYGDYALKDPRRTDTALPETPQRLMEDPGYGPQPRYWMPSTLVDGRLERLTSNSWLLVWRDITNATNERTLISTIMPRTATDFTIRVGFLAREPSELWSLTLLALFNSFISDYLIRQKLGGTHLSDYILRQLAAPTPEDLETICAFDNRSSWAAWLILRAAELTQVAWGLQGLTGQMGLLESPYRWDPARRVLLRSEIDAAINHLYGLERSDVEYVMETFPIVRRKDVVKYGSFRTKELILDIYDRMTNAIETGEPYQTILDPPPAHASLRVDVDALS